MLISIIIVTYNQKQLLKKCLFSVMKQDFNNNNFEIIVVDDKSIDGTPKILKDFEQFEKKNSIY
jgi:glycosyltransferase involved in cell wall biosynthesis